MPKHILRILLSCLFLFNVFIHLSVCGQPAFSQINSYKMVINPAFTALADTTMQKDTSKEITILYKDKPNPQSYKYIMGIFQLPLPSIHSGAGLMVNYNTVSYYLPGFFQNPFGRNPYQYINPNSIRSSYTEWATKLYYRNNLNKNVSIGVDVGGIKYNFTFKVPGTDYEINPSTIYSDVGMLYKNPHWIWSLSLGYDFISPSNLPFAIYTKGFPNYSPFTYNVLAEYRTNFRHVQLDVIAYSSYSPSGLQAMSCFHHFLLLGASVTTTENIFNVLTGSYVFTGGHYVMASTPTYYSRDYYPSIIIGVKLFNDHLKITFSYDIYPKSADANDTGPFTSSKQNTETVINDQFN